MTGTLLVVAAIVVGLAIAGVVAVRRSRQRAADAAAARLRNEAEANRVYPLLARAMAALPSTEYLADSDVRRWQANHSEAIALARQDHLAAYLPPTDAERFRTWCTQVRNLRATVRDLNERFISIRLAEEQLPFDRVERYPLTARQRRAIVTSEETTLVIAGAGTGKTSTIVGKVDYLLRRGFARPEEVLVLAFARKAREELQDRFATLGIPAGVEVSTFHALGNRIVATVDGAKPALSVMAEDDQALKRFLRERIRELLVRPDRQHLLVSFWSRLLDEEEPNAAVPKDGDTLIREQKARGLRALNGTKLKSREEVKIANWLTLSGIAWEYERPYPVNLATTRHRRYQPDFYLPAHDLYIEHFGIDRHGNPAPHIDAEAYRAAMEWKRQIHQQYQTTLVETFSSFGTELIPNLEALLRVHEVEPRRLTQAEIDTLTAEGNSAFSDFVSLVAQFLTLFSGNGADLQATRARAISERDHVFLTIFDELRTSYRAELDRRGEIDFNDMINRARDGVRAGRFPVPYRYLIVDEFQDISINRLGLLQELRARQPDARLFVVGDDWQSIYRFTGSDVGLITQLPAHVGATERVDLDVAFRYPQELLDATAAFITRNPAQLRKTLRSHHGRAGMLPICILFEQRASAGAPSVALESVRADILTQTSGNAATVGLLGRYRHTSPDNLMQIQQTWKRSGLAVEFLTAHGSKGQERDFIVVLGLEAGEYGFPSNVADDPVMHMVLSQDEPYSYAEERRLFYVAMTRARRRVYLIAPQDNASPFVVDDLLGDALRPFVATIGEVSVRHRCPTCHGQTIRRTEGQYGAFWACSHYPLCDGKLDACPHCREGGLTALSAAVVPVFQCISCQKTVEGCPRCRKGFLLERNGKYGPFLACSRWSGGDGCTYTRN